MAPANVRLNPVGVIVAVVLAICIFFYVFGIPGFASNERISMRELLSVSVDLAQRGGKRVKEIAEDQTLDAKEKGKTKEGAKEMLTQGDLESHRAIMNGFLKTYPGITVRFVYFLFCTFFSVFFSPHSCVLPITIDRSVGGR